MDVRRAEVVWDIVALHASSAIAAAQESRDRSRELGHQHRCTRRRARAAAGRRRAPGARCVSSRRLPRSIPSHPGRRGPPQSRRRPVVVDGRHGRSTCRRLPGRRLRGRPAGLVRIPLARRATEPAAPPSYGRSTCDRIRRRVGFGFGSGVAEEPALSGHWVGHAGMWSRFLVALPGPRGDAAEADAPSCDRFPGTPTDARCVRCVGGAPSAPGGWCRVPRAGHDAAPAGADQRPDRRGCGRPPIFNGGGAATSTLIPHARPSGSTTTTRRSPPSSSRTGTVAGVATRSARPATRSTMRDVVWPRALEQIDRLESGPVEMAARDDDVALLEALTDAGFELHRRSRGRDVDAGRRPTGRVAAPGWVHAPQSVRDSAAGAPHDPSQRRPCRRPTRGMFVVSRRPRPRGVRTQRRHRRVRPVLGRSGDGCRPRRTDANRGRLPGPVASPVTC